MVQLAYYQHKLKQGYDTSVKLRQLAPGDLVLRNVLDTTKTPAWKSLRPNWEGSYHITSVAGINAYYLLLSCTFFHFLKLSFLCDLCFFVDSIDDSLQNSVL